MHANNPGLLKDMGKAEVKGKVGGVHWLIKTCKS